MFITIEDETGVANLVVWPSVFKRQRRIVLSAGMMSVRGKIQREGAFVHLVAHHLTDLSADLASVGERDGSFPLPHGRSDQVRDGGSFSPDQRDLPPRTHQVRDIYIPDLHIDAIKVGESRIARAAASGGRAKRPFGRTPISVPLSGY
jgi:error-prone DNA polymerase